MIRTGKATLWEIAIMRGDTRYLLVYTNRHSRSQILDAARKHGPKLITLTGVERITFGRRSAEGATMGDWTINYTGRTQRDAHATGQYPWMGDYN